MQLISTAGHVALYDFDIATQKWVRCFDFYIYEMEAAYWGFNERTQWNIYHSYV